MQDLLWALHRVPNLAILALIVSVLTGIATLAPHLGRRVLRLKRDEARSQSAMEVFKAVLAMTGVVLAFALVEANNNLHLVGGLVAKEGAALATADRALLRSGNPQLMAIRPLLSAYGKSIVDDEWPILAQSDRSDITDEAYNILSKEARTVNPTDARQQAMFSELLKSLDDLADLREQRIAESEADLPAFFWTTTFGLLLVAFVLGLMTSDTLASSVTLGATAAAISLLLSFVIIVDQPFSGETSVTSKEIVKAMTLNAHRH